MARLRLSNNLFISTLLILLILSACKKEEENTEEKIIGIWTIYNVNIDASIKGMTLYNFYSYQNSTTLQLMQAGLDSLQQ